VIRGGVGRPLVFGDTPIRCSVPFTDLSPLFKPESFVRRPWACPRGACRRYRSGASQGETSRIEGRASISLGARGIDASSPRAERAVRRQATAARAADLQAYGSAIDAQYCLLGTALSGLGGDNLFSDAPGLSALADHGGPTRTMALVQGSLARNAGSSGAAKEYLLPGVFQVLSFDQRGAGFPRTLADAVDIGAFQHQGDRIFADGMEGGP
jgi:hypothetical protein